MTTTARTGYYALAKRGNDYGIIWFEIRPNRGNYWTGETTPTQNEADAIVSARNANTPICPPSSDALIPVTS